MLAPLVGLTSLKNFFGEHVEVPTSSYWVDQHRIDAGSTRMTLQSREDRVPTVVIHVKAGPEFDHEDASDVLKQGHTNI